MSNMLTPLQQDTRSQVTKAAVQYSVPPELAQAVNYIESRYGANTGPSSAGAQGEMQIMPSTAQDIAVDHNKQYGTKWTARDVLTDKDTNIKAGVFYLKQGLDKFNNNESKALFRYNPSYQYVADVQKQRVFEAQQPYQDTQMAQLTQQPLTQQPRPNVLNTPFTLSPQEGEPGYTPAVSGETPGQVEFNAMTQRAQAQEQRYQAATLARQANIDIDDGIPTAAKWMTVIAALMGNMEPMIRLKLKSNENILTAKAQPLLKEAMQLEAEGQRDKSFELLQQAQSQFGSKVPALGQQINARLDQVRGDRLAYNDAKANIDMLLKSVPKDDERRSHVETLAIGLKANLPGMAKAVQDYIAQSGLQQQYLPAANAMNRYNQFLGVGSQRPIDVNVGPDAVNSYAIKQIAADNSRTPQDVVNALNNPQHPMQQHFAQEYAKHSGVQNRMNIQVQIPGTPENLAAIQVLSRHGDSNPQLTLSQGIKDPTVMDEIVKQQQFNMTQLAKAPIGAVQETERLERGGQVALSYDSQSTNRLSYQRHGTPNDAMRKGKVIFDANSPVLAETRQLGKTLVSVDNFRKAYSQLTDEEKGTMGSKVLRLIGEQTISAKIPIVGVTAGVGAIAMSTRMEKALAAYNHLNVDVNAIAAMGGHDSTAVQNMLNRIYGSFSNEPAMSSIHLSTLSDWLDSRIQQNLQQGGVQQLQSPVAPTTNIPKQPKKRNMVPVK